MEKCPNCDEWLVGCPCCDTAFCPECGDTEEMLEEGDDE